MTVGRRRPDVVVVGAGAIGAACAYELARAGLAVTIVERREPGAEASGASAGLLSAFTGDRAGGILLTPVTARIVRDWVVEGHTDLPVAPIAPDRLAWRPGDRPEHGSGSPPIPRTLPAPASPAQPGGGIGGPFRDPPEDDVR